MISKRELAEIIARKAETASIDFKESSTSSQICSDSRTKPRGALGGRLGFRARIESSGPLLSGSRRLEAGSSS